MGKSAKRKSLSPSEKLNDLQDFLSRHGVPPIVFRVLPHITLKNRKDWSKPCHLKEMTENDIKNEWIPDDAKKTLRLLIFWVTRKTQSENTWTQEKEDTYEEACFTYKNHVMLYDLTHETQSENTWTQEKEDTYEEDCFTYKNHVMLDDLTHYLTLHDAPEFEEQREKARLAYDVHVMFNNLTRYLTRYKIAEFAKQWFAKRWCYTWQLKKMTDNDFVVLKNYAKTLNPPEKLTLRDQKMLEKLIRFVKHETQEDNVMTLEKNNKLDSFNDKRNEQTDEMRQTGGVNYLQTSTQMMILNPYFVKLT